MSRGYIAFVNNFYLFYVAEHLQSEFPNLLSYNRFVELERKIIIPFALFLKLICFGQCTGITFIDSTKMAVCKNKRIKRNRVFKDMATIGKSTMGWFYGFKLHLAVNDKGELLNFCVTPANVDDRDWSVIQPLCKQLFGKLYGDKGYISASLCELLFFAGRNVYLLGGLRIISISRQNPKKTPHETPLHIDSVLYPMYIGYYFLTNFVII
ncbi:MAG: IS982 family transposase [Dysgonamonadaceae bacterium]|nr:IS982 family transposase [Dysgonamonadaceae bacterium]